MLVLRPETPQVPERQPIQPGHRKATDPPTKGGSDDEDKFDVGSSKHSIFFSSTGSSDSDLTTTTDDTFDMYLDHSPDKGGLDDKGCLDQLIPAIEDEAIDYPYSSPVEVHYDSWIPGIALDIKLHSRIFRCESLNELKDLEVKMEEDGQNTELLAWREKLLEDLEYKELWKYKMTNELIDFFPYVEGKYYNIDEKEALLMAAKDYFIKKELVLHEWYKDDGHLDLLLSEFYGVVEMCTSMLEDVEGDKFHPLIRKGYMNDLRKLMSLSERSHKSELVSIKLNPKHFMVEDCLARRVVERFFADKIKTDKNYVEANKKLSLLKMFEWHIASLDFMKILKDMNIDLKKEDFNPEEEAGKLIRSLEVVPEKYGSLEKDLIKQSLEERLFFAKIYAQLGWYGSYLLDIIEEKDENGVSETRMDLLIGSSGGARFFECSKNYAAGLIDDSVWEEKEIRDFIEAVGKEAFPDLPKQYVVRGILDYNDYLELEKYHEEFSSSIRRQLHSLEEYYWRTTRYFDHEIYKNSMLTERIDWGEVKDIEKNLNDILEEMRRSK